MLCLPGRWSEHSERDDLMTCEPCARARRALAEAGRYAKAGQFGEAMRRLPEVADALAEKVEALRVRSQMRQRIRDKS